jgi:hypothetical protein
MFFIRHKKASHTRYNLKNRQNAHPRSQTTEAETGITNGGGFAGTARDVWYAARASLILNFFFLVRLIKSRLFQMHHLQYFYHSILFD